MTRKEGSPETDLAGTGFEMQVGPPPPRDPATRAEAILYGGMVASALGGLLAEATDGPPDPEQSFPDAS